MNVTCNCHEMRSRALANAWGNAAKNLDTGTLGFACKHTMSSALADFAKESEEGGNYKVEFSSREGYSGTNSLSTGSYASSSNASYNLKAPIALAQYRKSKVSYDEDGATTYSAGKNAYSSAA